MPPEFQLTNEVKQWKANPGKQETFLSIPDTIFEGFYGGAAGGAKSETLFMIPIVREFYKIPGHHSILLRRTYPELEKSLIVRAHEWYPHFGGEWNDQKHRYKFPSGAVVDFGHCEHETDVRKYDSAQFQYVGFDELTGFTEFIYKYIALERCRSNIQGVLPIVRSASNPGNIGHGWVRKRFVEPCREGGKIIVTNNKRDDGSTFKSKLIFVQSFVTDNPHIMKNDPSYVDRLQLLPEAEKRAKLYGDWWIYSGQVFGEFRSEKLPGEPSNALHVIAPFKIPDYIPKLLIIDWGHQAMLYAQWIACFPNHNIITYREYIGLQEKNVVWSANLKRLSQDEVINRVIMGRDSWNKHGDTLTIAEQFTQITGWTPFKADTDRIGGKMLMHEYLRWTPRPERYNVKGKISSDYYSWVLRNKGDVEAGKYLNSFNRDEESEVNLPRWQIFNTCPVLIRTLPLCVYNTKSGTNPEDVAEFNGDDPYDNSRYGLKAAEEFFNVAGKNEDQALASSEICEELQATGNINRFYNKMANLEIGQKNRSFGVRRRSRYARAN